MKYITAQGTEGTLEGAGDLEKAVLIGLLSAGTLVQDDATGRWIRAMEHPQLAPTFAGAVQAVARPEDVGRDTLLTAVMVVWAVGLVVPPFVSSFLGDPLGVLVFSMGRVFGDCLVLGLAALIFVRRRRSRLITALVLGSLFGLSLIQVVGSTHLGHQRLPASVQIPL